MFKSSAVIKSDCDISSPPHRYSWGRFKALEVLMNEGGEGKSKGEVLGGGEGKCCSYGGAPARCSPSWIRHDPLLEAPLDYLPHQMTPLRHTYF